MTDGTVQEEPTAVAYGGDYEPIDDLGDALALTQNGRAKITSHSRVRSNI